MVIHELYVETQIKISLQLLSALLEIIHIDSCHNGVVVSPEEIGMTHRREPKRTA